MAKRWVDKINQAVARSVVGRYFQLEGSCAKRERKGTKFTTELRAGCTTFFAMAYIISVNASIISDSGGTCECTPTESDPTCDNDAEYMICINTFRNQLIVGTAIVSMIATFLMGFGANLPLGMAPGMGLNAYFTYNVVGYHGSGKVPFRTAIAAVFIEGFIFIVLTILGIRQMLARLIPMSIKYAMSVGIGLFLCFVGLQSSEGIGLVGADTSTLVTLGGCPSEYKDATTGECTGHHMESGTLYMGILGLLIMSILLLYRIRGALLIGIVFIAITSWPRVNKVTLFPYTETGDSMFNYFKQVVTLPSLDMIKAPFHFDLSHREIWIALITFLYVDILDTTGTLYSMAKYGGYMDCAGDFERSTVAFLVDATSIVIGSCFSSSPVTAFVESGAGIAEGGRTGLTAIMISFGFFISIFFSPIFASFPAWGTGPALVLVGAMMCSTVRNINWDYPGDAIPAFITLAVMPFTYSIAYGVVGGIIAYIIINGVAWILGKATFGRIRPDYSQKEEYLKHVLSKSLAPTWMQFLIAKAKGKPFSWEEEYDFGEYQEGSATRASGTGEIKVDNYPEAVVTSAMFQEETGAVQKHSNKDEKNNPL